MATMVAPVGAGLPKSSIISTKVNLQSQIDFTKGVHMAPALIRTFSLATYVCPTDVNAGSFTVFASGNQPITDVAHANYVAMYGSGNITANQNSVGNGVFYRN